MPGGDYLYYQTTYARRVEDYTVLAADTATIEALTPRSANHRIYVQVIVYAVTTLNAATLTFQDETAVTPLVLARSITNAPIGPLRWDFGPAGTPLALGTGLDVVLSAAGSAGRIHIEAYEKLEGAVAQAGTN